MFLLFALGPDALWQRTPRGWRNEGKRDVQIAIEKAHAKLGRQAIRVLLLTGFRHIEGLILKHEMMDGDPLRASRTQRAATEPAPWGVAPSNISRR
jgi:hypothetical protein